MPQKVARRGKRRLATKKNLGTASFGELSASLLAEYSRSRAVTEVVIVENDGGNYRLEVLLTWREGRSVLTAARGGARRFRSLDTIVGFLRSSGVGTTSIRVELKN